jgi:hypothetical protein
MKLTTGLVVAFVLAVLAIVAVFAHGVATATCEDPDTLADSRLYEQAREGYEAILEDDAGADCAVEGLLEVAEQLCRQAERIRKSGADGEAAKAYTAILSFQPLEEPRSDDDEEDEEEEEEEQEEGEEEKRSESADSEPLQCALDGLALLRPKDKDKKKPCECPATCVPACPGAERQEREIQEPEEQEAERQEAERQEAERQEAERQEAERQEDERQEPEDQEPELQEPEQDDPDPYSCSPHTCDWTF